MYLGNVILCTAGAIPDLEKQVRRAMGNINPGLPVTSVFPFAQQVQRHLDSSR
jgi:hypothetical protein